MSKDPEPRAGDRRPLDPAEVAALSLVAELYHAWITGLVLTLLGRRDAATAERFVFRLFRKQHLERFLPGLAKLGLDREPHALAAAKYHYFSNQLGGVAVEYLRESDRKAWVRYPPPRWIWMGTALCAIPSEVNRAMLRGWHAHNGVSLGNPRLGFVCTKTTVDGQPGLEGYYLEQERDLEPDERLSFRPEESAPPIPRDSLPVLDAATWPAERKHRAARNYAMEYLRNGLPVLAEIVGPEEARFLGRICGLQIGMHCHRDIASSLGITDDSADSFLTLFEHLTRAQGDRVTRGGDVLAQRSWRLFQGAPTPHEAVFDGWNAVWEGLLAAHNRFLRLRVTHRLDQGDDRFEWRVEERPPRPAGLP
jgi:hypothetical protein